MIAPLAATADVFIPDGDEARRWAEEELSKGDYQAAKPTWFDRMVTDVVEWLFELFANGGDGSVAPIATTIIVTVIVAALVVALIVWGRPRASRSVRKPKDLLGELDDRTAAQLRAEAAARAKERDWNGAIVLRFRGLARSLMERDVIDPAPGVTAQGIARAAAAPFPGFADRVHAAATSFDAVRSLGSDASEADYLTLAAVDDDLRAAAPVLATAEAVPA